MPTVQQQREKLINLLKQLFQLDQPDLDFGFYKIMHAKSEQVQRFLENDLLDIIKQEFGELDDKRVEEAKAKYEAAIQTAKDYGSQNPEEAPAVKDAKAEYESAKKSGGAEGEIYDHLWRFFERYYDNGDFLSRRYYARETAGKAAPYAVPYDGREVYLHWANKDQYYIKTSEYLTNFTFNPAKSKEYRELAGELLPQDEQSLEDLKVHCRIIEATEGEHGNIKASEGQQRYFIIHQTEPVKLENNELLIQFEYRPDSEKTGQDNTWKQKRLDEAVETVLAGLSNLPAAKAFLDVLSLPAPTDKQKDRKLLARYLNQYTARNTMDYFIHKDLGGFLRRELDFYIKNEIMRLDDIENADAPKVESYLAKIRVLRKIAGKLIDFLAQLEEFQKKLWLKKKFVVETNYCITLDRIFAIGSDEENAEHKAELETVRNQLAGQIIANKEQIDEWIRLFAIDEIQADIETPSYSQPLTVEFLKANDKLVLDTQFFDRNFKQVLLSVIEDFDELFDGLLIHSDNFQALNLLRERYTSQVKCIYVDPPYNTGKDEFIYRDSYQHSSWASFMFDRVSMFRILNKSDGATFISIDDNESKNAQYICNMVYGSDNFLAPIYIQVRYANKTLSEDNDFQRTIEQVLFYAKSSINFRPFKELAEYPIKKFTWKITEKSKGTQFEVGGKKCFVFKPGEFEIVKAEPGLDMLKETWATGSLLRQKGSSGEFFGIHLAPRKEVDGVGCLYKVIGIGEDGLGYRYFTGPRKESATKGKFFSGIPMQTLDKIKSGDATKEIPIHNFMDFAGDFGNCRHEGRVDISGGKKPEKLIEKLIGFSSNANNQDIVLDPFSGSGTMSSVAHKLRKKYIAIEHSDYFDTKLLTRMKYTFKGVANGLAERPGGILKYLRVESYEDTLNNLNTSGNENSALGAQSITPNQKLTEDYMLHYMLGIESRGSQSLLNIEGFADPEAYALKIKRPGSDDYQTRNVDLIETFNYLIGLHVDHIDKWCYFDADFKREPDSELSGDSNTKLIIDSRLKERADGRFGLRKIEGWVCRTPGNNEDREKVLIVWRKLSGNLEEDNAVLDEWFRRLDIRSRNTEFDVIYVNGSNNLPNLRREDEHWKVRLLEETFHQKMWDIEDV